MAKNWILAAVLWGMTSRWRPPPGVVFWSFVSLYGIVRLTQSQIFSGLMALLGGVMVIRRLMRRRFGET